MTQAGLTLALLLILLFAGCATPAATPPEKPPGADPAQAPPMGLLPEDGIGEVPQPVAFAWTGIGPGEVASVFVRAGTSGLFPLAGCEEVLGETCVAHSDLTPGQTYWWQVRTTSPMGEAWSEPAAFTVEGTLAPTALTFFRANRTLYDVPLALSPPNRAAGIRLGSTLSWQPYPLEGVSYHVRAATLNGTLELCRTEATSCKLPALPGGEQLTWWIEVVQGDRLLAVSLPRSAVAYAVPPPLAPISPLPGGAVHGTRVRFEWLPQAAFAHHPVQVFAKTVQDSRFLLVCETMDTSCEAEFPRLTEFDWYAQATDGTSVVATPLLAARTGGPPLLPVPLYPPGEAENVPLRTTLRWSTPGDPTGEPVEYEAEILVAGEWRRLCRTIGSWCPLDVELGKDRVTWRVRSQDASGNAVTSAQTSFLPVRFQTELTPLEPRDGMRGLSTTQTFTWLASTLATNTRTHVEISLDGAAWRSVCQATTTTCTATGLPKGASYQWRVRAEGLAQGTSPLMQAESKLPIVFLHGWTGDAATWREAAAALQLEEYVAVIPEFTPADQREHIPGLALKVATQVDAELARLGYPAGQPFHLVGHSMGGLLGRTLIEHPGAGTAFDQGGWNQAAGTRLPVDWATRVRTYTSVGTPHAGTLSVIGVLCQVGGEFAPVTWLGATCADMMPHSSFINTMGPAQPGLASYDLISGTSALGLKSLRGNLAVAILCLGAHDGLICTSSALSTRGGTVHDMTGCHAKVVTITIPKVPITPTCEGPLITKSAATALILKDVLSRYATSPNR